MTSDNIPFGYCQCGCGQKTELSDRTDLKHNLVMDEPRRFIKGHNAFIPIKERFWTRVTIGHNNECWIWNGSISRLGYGRIHYNNKLTEAHRVAWTLTYGDIPFGKNICHSCDNPPCVNPSHLFVGTHAANMLDKETKGRGNHAKGVRSGAAKLTEDQVLRIRELAANGTSFYRLAKIYNVSDVSIGNIVRRRTWKHI